MPTLLIASALACCAFSFIAYRATRATAAPAAGANAPARFVSLRHPTSVRRVPAEWQVAVAADLTAAEGLLDELEASGCADRELVVLGNSTFAVRWRDRPAHDPTTPTSDGASGSRSALPPLGDTATRNASPPDRFPPRPPTHRTL